MERRPIFAKISGVEASYCYILSVLFCFSQVEKGHIFHTGRNASVLDIFIPHLILLGPNCAPSKLTTIVN